jgi:adenylate kinase family enzyme
MQHRALSVAMGLIGHARSGKTTLIRDLAALLPHAQLVSFGDVIRDRARQLGQDSTDRSVLVDLGQRWVGEDPSELCDAVLSRADATARPLIIDGLRHRRIADELARQLRPRRLIVVYLDAPRHLLLQRLCAAGMTPQQAATLLVDPTELEIDGPLRALADLIVDATNSPAANLQYLLDNLARHGIATH